MLRIPLCLAWLVAWTPAWAQTDSVSVRAETGWFNRAYQDREFVSASHETFGVPYAALGAEFQRRDAEGNVLGGAVAQTTVGSGSVRNVDRTERQPLMALTLASVFVGRDGGWWQVDLGVGALVQLQDYGASRYLRPDGSSATGRSDGLDWNRRESFTLFTLQARLFPLSGPHVAFRLARGDLSLTENLFHLQAVLPTEGGRFDAEISFSSPQGYWFAGPGFLRNNERLSIGCAFGSDFRWGLRGGLLLRPMVAGTGAVDLWHRLSFGVEMAASWPDH